MELFHNINYKGIIDQEEVSMVLHRYKYGIVYLPKGYESGGRVNQKMYDYLMCGCIPIIINGSREMKSLVGPNFYISLEEESNRTLRSFGANIHEARITGFIKKRVSS